MKNALIVWGGWNGHEPEKCAGIAANILRNEGYNVEISSTLDSYLDEKKMKAVNLVVPVWTMGAISAEQEKSVPEAREIIRRGMLWAAR